MSIRCIGKLVVALVACALVACSERSPSLTVRVITGLVPGPEFRLVQTTVLDAPALPTSARVVDSSEAVARFGLDFARGKDVAAFELPRGDYRVRVRLLRPNGALLVDRVVALALNSDTVLPVHLTRDCVGVICPAPGGASELSTCLAGECVDPRCTPATPEFCPSIDFCNQMSECGATASCASVSCAEGVCTPTAEADACRDDEWCNPDIGAGCQPFAPNVPMDGVPCGTICASPALPCQFGYWNCDVVGMPQCETLTNRPVGFVCGVDRACDVAGDCVIATSSGAGFVVTPTSGLTTSERRGMTTFTMSLTTAPSSDVTVSISTSDYTEGGVTPTLVRFTPLDWNALHVVTVTGINDAERDGDVVYTIITAPAESDDPNYHGLNAPDVSITNVDDDAPGITFSRVSGLVTTESGGSDSFTVVLNAAPSAPVSIDFESDTLSEATVFPSSLTFSVANWASPQMITVRGVNDSVRDGDMAFHVVTSAIVSSDSDYAALDVLDVSGVNRDDDTAGIVVAPSSLLGTNEAGAVTGFSVALRSQPSASVVIPLVNGDASEGSISVSSLMFTPSTWNVTQTVSIMGVDDAVADGNQIYAIGVGPAMSADSDYDGLVGTNVMVLNYDDETAGFTVTPNVGLTSENSSTTSFSVVLRSQPLADVEFSFTSTDTSEGTVAPASLMFTTTNWNVPQSVVVTGVDDILADGQQPYEVIVHVMTSADATYAALGDQRVFLANDDNESAGVTVMPTSGLTTTEAGGTASFTVVLNAAPTEDVIISLASSDATEGFVSPNELTFTGVDWNVPQTVTVTGVDDVFPDANVLYTVVTSDAVSASDAYNGMVVPDVSVRNTNDDPWPYEQEAFGKASNTGTDDTFGFAIAISADGNTMAVGAPNEDSSASGIDGNQSDDAAMSAGAVYVFARSGSTWIQQAYVKASNTDTNDRFGCSLALSADGNTLAVGAYHEGSAATGINGNQADNTHFIPGAGAVYVYTRAGVTWTQEAYVKASNTGAPDWFGHSVALSSDGNTLAVSALNEASNGTGVGADQSNNAASTAGAAYVFTRVASTWTQQAYIKASNTDSGDKFGWSMSLASDGDTLAIGAYWERSAATGIGGNQANNSALSAGAVYVFARAGMTWSQQAYVKASNTAAQDYFGQSVALSGDGNTLAVGAPYEDSAAVGVGGNQADNSMLNSGAVYVYTRSGSVWSQQAYVKASNTGAGDAFGYSVALSADGSVLAVGAYLERSSATGVGADELDDSLMNIGAVYSFVRVSGVWSQQVYVKASHIDGPSGKRFGECVALSADGETMLVSAPGEGSSSTGIGGSESGGGATNSGAIYSFVGT